MAVPTEHHTRGKRVQTLIFPSADAIHRPPPLPPEDRPSERPTRPTLVPADESVIELSAADFESVEPPPSSRHEKARERQTWLGLAVRATIAGIAIFTVVATVVDGRASAAPGRSPRLAWPERTTIGEPAIAPPPSPERGRCVVTGPPRLVAPRGELKPGLDVVASGTGFVVSLVATPNEAWAVRLEGSRLRGAESVHVRSAAPIRHVAAHDGESLDVRLDTDAARTVVGDADGTSFRLVPVGSSLVARADEAVHPLWLLPGADPARKTPGTVDVLRAAPRDDGGAVVAMKKGSTLHLGIVHASFATAGPLATITSAGATMGTPAVAARGSGGVVAWAERAPGAHDYHVMVATFGGPTTAIDTRSVGAGISPSVAVLPDGGVLVAHAEGPPALHRVVVRRFGADLAPVGQPLVASPETVNAGQPVVEVAPDGRALVAWFGVARGQAPSVHATPLACDVSTYRD